MLEEATALRPSLPRLEPCFDIAGVPHAMLTLGLAAIPVSEFAGEPIAALSGHDYEIRKALDFLCSGI